MTRRHQSASLALEWLRRRLADGEAATSISRTTQMSCNMDISAFPFDHQKCQFTVGSQFYDSSDCELVPRYLGNNSWSAVSLENYVSNLEWRLKNISVVSKCTQYSCCPACFPTLTFIFEMHRWSWVYVCGIIVPLITITYVNILGGLLHPFSGERVSLSVTMMLTGAAIYLVAADSMPKIGTLTFISRLYLSSLRYTCFFVNCVSFLHHPNLP